MDTPIHKCRSVSKLNQARPTSLVAEWEQMPPASCKKSSRRFKAVKASAQYPTATCVCTVWLSTWRGPCGVKTNMDFGWIVRLLKLSPLIHTIAD